MGAAATRERLGAGKGVRSICGSAQASCCFPSLSVCGTAFHAVSTACELTNARTVLHARTVLLHGLEALSCISSGSKKRSRTRQG